MTLKPSMFWDRLWDLTLILLLSMSFKRSSVKNLVVKSWKKEGRLPDYVIACVGGGSNAIGAFFTVCG